MPRNVAPESDSFGPPALPAPVAGRPRVSLEVAADAACEAWATQKDAGRLREGSRVLYERQLDTFLRFAAVQGIQTPADLTTNVLRAWINAPISPASPGSRARAGQASSASTRRGRQGVLRRVVAIWAERGWVDPSLMPADTIKKAPALLPRPLTPAEADDLRIGARRSAADSLLPALVALALAGVSGTEIACLKLADWNPATGTLSVRGRAPRGERTLRFDDGPSREITTHVAALRRVAGRRDLPRDPAVCPLALPTAPRTHRTHVTVTAVGQHLYRALQVAGLHRPGVVPTSMQDFAANRCYALTNRVEDVAALLGLSSLDTAFRTIDPAWQAQWGEAIRTGQV